MLILKFAKYRNLQKLVAEIFKVKFDISTGLMNDVFEFVGNKAKGQICVQLRGKGMFVFRKIWHALFSWNTRFEIGPFALLPTSL